ncbi:ankyrin containing protein [Heterostelium album PN500]|uniref:Ankyrin containing protein n=1 Tax=Heterostelium pallidum (strain ATCC 26659 / Pp 5 / PN500) TaxID=670386 RepID=D3BG63_HETP5|nr:ankyrin containing protein [Heterostelium album PN500]EFA79655.1 ankyrin containing protein [Heterostelium album PN500]|eukprot:XP_020431776.1 ankyrin containing protein [Heterostelium album PN500]
MEKDKFLKIFNNCVLNRLIFKHVKSIHDVIGGVRYRWSDLIKNPRVMAGYSYLNELKLYYEDHSIGSLQANDIFKAAIKTGNIEILKYLVDLAKPISVSSPFFRSIFDMILCDAVIYGSLEMVKHICTEFEKKRLNFHPAFVRSPLSGDIEMIKYLNEKLENCDFNNKSKRYFIFDYAAEKGRIDIIEWLFENRSEYREGSNMYLSAIKGGHLHVVQYLLDINEPIKQTSHPDHNTLFDESIFFNQLEIAKLLHQHNIRESQSTPIDYAASHGNISMLKWLNENTTVKASVNAMSNAAMNNHLEALKWLHQHRTEGCSDDIFSALSRKGHIEVIQWLYENQSNVLQSQLSIYEAISYGHLELAKWLFENRNEPPSPFAVGLLAMNESETHNLEMIKWLHENHPVGFTENTILYTIENGHFETMKWLRENRTDISSLKQLNLNNIYTGDEETINWLSENFNIDWNKIIKNEVRKDNSEMVDIIIKKNLVTIDSIANNYSSSSFHFLSLMMVKWFHNNKIQSVFNDKSMENSIRAMNFPLVKWLYENRSDCQCSSIGFQSAIQTGHMGMIEYLLAKHPEFGHQTSLTKCLEMYFRNDDIEMIEFLFDKIDFPLDELKAFQKKIKSSTLSDNSKTLLNNHIQKKIKFEIHSRSGFQMEKDKFLKIFNNCVLNKLIFKHVKSIHNVIGGDRYGWSDVIENPRVMAGNSYLNELKLYYTDNSIGSNDVNDTFRAAIKSGNIEMLKYLVELVKPVSGNIINFDIILRDAAKQGSLEMVKHMCTEFEKKSLDYRSAFSKSPLSGDIEMIKYLNEKLAMSDHKEFDYLYGYKSIFYYAAKIGRIDIIEWLFENISDDKAERYLYYGAIKGGHLHVVQYLLDINEPLGIQQTPQHNGTLFDYSIVYNQLEIAKLLHQHNIRESLWSPIDYAASKGNIECLKWLNENTTVKASVYSMNNAAINNHLEVLKWLQQHRTEGCNTSVIRDVSRKGHIEVIQWLYENQSNVLQSQQSIKEAIRYGHLELAKWLFEKRNEQPSEDAIDYGVKNKSETHSLEMIKWLHENHPTVRCTEQAILNAIENGHFETMKWLRENRTEISTLKILSLIVINKGDAKTINWLSKNFIIDWDFVIRYAVRNDNSELVDIIINQNLCTIDDFDNDCITTAFYHGYLKMIKWFYNNNIQGVFNEESMEYAIRGLQFQLVKWLYENRSDCQCSFNAFQSAAIKSGHMGMIEYLLEKHPEFGHQISLEKSLENYLKEDDIEMIEFLLDKFDFPLVELKEFEKIINSKKEYSDISKTLMTIFKRKSI